MKISSFYEKVASPVMTDVELTVDGAYDLYPKQPGFLFRGSRLLVLGRNKKYGRANVVLKGKLRGKERVFEYTADFPLGATEYDYLPRLWATRKVGYLLRQNSPER